MMKKLFLLLMLVAGFYAFYEQSKPQPNLLLMLICIAVFMLELMKLMTKIPSKKQNEHDSFI